MAKLVFQCAACGADVHRTPSQAVKGKDHFCTHQCKGIWQAAHKHGAGHHQWTSTTIPCAYCGRSVSRPPWRIARYKNHFCDTTCMGKWQSAHRTGDANYSWRGGKVSVACAYCGQVFEDYASNRQGHNAYFCSRPCQAAWCSQQLSGENSATWKGGDIEYYGPNWRAQRRTARKRDKHTCQHCGKKEKQLRRALDVHHITPFRSFGYIPGVNEAYKLANALTNLVSLCSDCHKRAEHGHISLQLRLL